jgi:hypothetical protein
MNLAQKYSKSLAEQWLMRFKTKHPDGDNYDGVVTHIKSAFVVLREEKDFEWDGIIILPKRIIKGIRDGRYDRCYNQILRQNGAMKKLRSPGWLNSCETIPQVCASLMKRDIWPAIEIIFDDGAESAYYLGPITRVDEDRFFLRYYDAAGKWGKVYELDYDEVFKIEFDSRYCNHFNAYMKSESTQTTSARRTKR